MQPVKILSDFFTAWWYEAFSAPMLVPIIWLISSYFISWKYFMSNTARCFGGNVLKACWN